MTYPILILFALLLESRPEAPVCKGYIIFVK